MKKIKEFIKEKGIPRRSFLKLAGLSSVGLSLGFPLKTKWAQASEQKSRKMKANWQDDPDGNRYFVKKNLMTNWANNDDPFVLARYDGWWWAFPVREFDDEFQNWWIAEKTWYYDQFIAFFKDEIDELVIPNGGHHHPMLTTYGDKWFNRGDSKFHLNTTPKGFTMIPLVDKIDYINDQLEEARNEPDYPLSIFEKRRELYRDKTLWDKTRFATLELYSGRPINDNDRDKEGELIDIGFQETHTFQNVMENPMSTLTYMSLYNTDGTQDYFDGNVDETPTFEFRGFSWLISYYDPNLTKYEKDIAKYINDAHAGYHGGADDIATNIFLITEEFNNTPGFDPYGRGKRVVPPYNYGVSGKKVAKTTAKRRNMTRDEKIELLKNLRITV